MQKKVRNRTYIYNDYQTKKYYKGEKDRRENEREQKRDREREKILKERQKSYSKRNIAHPPPPQKKPLSF